MVPLWRNRGPARRFGDHIVVQATCAAAVMVASQLASGQERSPSAQPPGVQAEARASNSAANLIRSGREMFEDQRYDESIQTLSAALLNPTASKKERIEVYRLLAYNYIVLSHGEEAEAAVRGLFAIDPRFELAANESPRFREFFRDAKKRWESEGRPGLVQEPAPAPKPVNIRHTSPAQQDAYKEVRLWGDLDDPDSRTASLQLHYRTGTVGQFDRLDARLAQGKFRAVIPASVVRPSLVEYYFVAKDRDGSVVATRGEVATPLRIAITTPEGARGGLLSNPWFWTGAGALVVGGVIGALLLSRGSDSPSTQHTVEPPANNSRVIVIIGQE